MHTCLWGEWISDWMSEFASVESNGFFLLSSNGNLLLYFRAIRLSRADSRSRSCGRCAASSAESFPVSLDGSQRPVSLSCTHVCRDEWVRCASERAALWAEWTSVCCLCCHEISEWCFSLVCVCDSLITDFDLLSAEFPNPTILPPPPPPPSLLALAPFPPVWEIKSVT